MPTGPGHVLLVRLDGDRATHFSPIVDLELETGATKREQVELFPAMQIKGVLSENVARPARNGRLVAQRFRLDRATVVCLAHLGSDCRKWDVCDRRVARGRSGAISSHFVMVILPSRESAPRGIEQPRKPDDLHRPQVFLPPPQKDPIVLRMSPMVRCEIETVDEKQSPVAGVVVYSCPNVGWWNDGSNCYCTNLVRGERLLLKRDYRVCIDDVFSMPFKSSTDANGRGELELPVGKQCLFAKHDDHELSIVCGRRERKVEVVSGATATIRLVLQRKGQEYIGEWDKVRGLLFGCSGPQCGVAAGRPEFP